MRLISLSIGAVLLAACAGATPEPEAIQVTWEELDEMIEAFGYEQGIRQFCEDTSATSQDDFLAELAGLSGFDAGLLEKAETRAAEVQAEFDAADPTLEQEYICTPEMFETSKDRANLARDTWAKLKGSDT